MARARRTKVEIAAFDAELFRIAERVQPATARQIYYRAVVAGLVPKTQKGYRRVCESLARQRWAGDLPWKWIADETRAVNPDDVETYELEVGDPPKRGGPGRTSWWTEDGPQLNFTVEAEAFEPHVLRSLVEDAIYRHADRERLERAWEVEALERETLLAVARRGVFSDLVRDARGPA